MKAISPCQTRSGGKHKWGAVERSHEDGQLVRFCLSCTTQQIGSKIPQEQRYWFEQLERVRKAGYA